MTSEGQFLKLTATAAEPLQQNTEIILALLGEFPFDTFETHDEHVLAFAKAEEITEALLAEINEILSPYISKAFDTEIIEKQNWNEEWEKQFFDPITVDDMVHIRAPFHPIGPEVPYCITIEPRMSFGTGHHRTTQMMISLMLKQQEAFQETKVLDMGCGTGVLGILAEKLGAKMVLGIDNEPWAVENAVDNASANECSRFTAEFGDAELLTTMNDGYFDVVLANIHLNVLMTDGKEYLRVLKSGGLLFVSGFYGQDLPLLNQYFTGLGAIRISDAQLDEWCAAVFRK
ncbi:MAG: 50S ribosomal protein L11 methyltransferase [Sphingomonadales bacterium]|nr:50S ribosomal protein L11 methyltransferase [Sphingomonadales bacterium]